MAKKRILITTLINPLTVNNLTLEYLIKNVNNGLVYFKSDCIIDLEFIFWQATKPVEELIFDNVHEFSEKYKESADEFIEYVNTEFKEELNKELQRKISNLDISYLNSIKGTKIRDIKFNQSFMPKYNYKGYGAVHQFELLYDHIEKNTYYDYYFFISSNFFINEKSFFQQYLDNIIESKIPFITHEPQLQPPVHKDDTFMEIRHANVNTFSCSPSLLIDFFKKQINITFDTKKLSDIGERLTLGTTFGIHGGVCIKNHKNCIYEDYTLKKSDFIDKKIFPFDNGDFEPAIQFPIFLLIFCTRYPDIYKIDFIDDNPLNITAPKYCFLNVSGAKENASKLIYFRYELFWEPHSTSVYTFNLFKKLNPNIKFKINDSILHSKNELLIDILKYLDNTNTEADGNVYTEYKGFNKFNSNNPEYWNNIHRANTDSCFKSVFEHYTKINN